MNEYIPDFRAEWPKRIEDHAGGGGWNGRIARWLKLATGLPDRDMVASWRAGLPPARFTIGGPSGAYDPRQPR